MKIMIGVPCYGNVRPELLEDWMVWMYHCGRRMPQYDFFTAIKTKSEQFRARNAIVEAALQVGADYLLMIDDDMIIDHDRLVTKPSEAYGFIEQLIQHKKLICGILYYQREGECRPVLMKKGVGKGYTFLRDDEIIKGLQKVDVAGGGCLLIDMKIFDKIHSPYFSPEYEYGTDIQLCKKATEVGFDIYADTSIEFGHLRQNVAVVTGKTRSLYQTGDMFPSDVKQKFVPHEMYEQLVRDGLEYTGYHNIDEMITAGNSFFKNWDTSKVSDLKAWYNQYPMQRVARQIGFNTQNINKRQMTEFIICGINHTEPLNILDFGCGIGITAFELARLGHHVTAMDVEGTETIAFLKWRCARDGVLIDFQYANNELVNLDQEYDIIIAMDSIEHVKDWKSTLAILSEHVKKDGYLFSNNAILEDDKHPEHLFVGPKEFLQECVLRDLIPINQLVYQKKEAFHGVANSK